MLPSSLQQLWAHTEAWHLRGKLHTHARYYRKPWECARAGLWKTAAAAKLRILSSCKVLGPIGTQRVFLPCLTMVPTVFLNNVVS